MSEIPASIKISLVNGEIEISGPVDFVEKQALVYTDLLMSKFDFQKIELSHPQQNQEETKPTKTKENISVDQVDYSNLFSFNDGKLNIHLNSIPGKSKREKMINMAYICLFGYLQNHVEEISTNDIREACIEYSILDSKNFMGAIRSNKIGFILSNSDGKKSIRLSKPGIKIAEEVIKEIKED